MTESTQREPGSPQLQPQSLQASTSSSLDSGSNLPNHARATGGTAHMSQPDTISDKATAAFIRRTLCSHNVLLGNGEKGGSAPRPIEELLPPLTSSNEVDLQLYGIISVIIKEFVQAWYSKITPDQVFVSEVIQIIAHCTRALEQRLRNVDLEALLLDEIPELLEAHLSAYRLAKQQAASPHSLVSDPRLIYHTLHPHPALSPVPTDLVPSTFVEQRESESAWRQLLIQGVLAVILPTDDLGNGCLRSLVAEIFAEMILGNGISGKACEGWLLWEGIAKIADVLQSDDANKPDRQSADASSDHERSRLERFGLLASRSDEQKASKSPVTNDYHRKTIPMHLSALFWTIMQYAFLACTALRAVFVTATMASSLPSRFVASGSLVDDGELLQPKTDLPAPNPPLESKRPIVSMKLWSCAAQLVELDVRMPWLSGFISMLHCGALVGPGRVGGTDGVLDRLLSHTIHTHILNPTSLPATFRTLRTTIFPNNGLGPPREIPSEEETKEIKRQCAASLLNLLPPKVAAIFFASHNRVAQHKQVEEILDCLDDTYLNKHLIFQIVELIVLRLVPELGQQGVQDLMEERIG